MKRPDNIEDLFRDRFESFEAPVDPAAWDMVRSKLPQASAPATGASAGAATGSKVVTWVAAGLIAAGSVATAVWFTSDADPVPAQVAEMPTASPQEPASEEPVQETTPAVEVESSEISTSPSNTQTANEPVDDAALPVISDAETNDRDELSEQPVREAESDPQEDEVAAQTQTSGTAFDGGAASNEVQEPQPETTTPVQEPVSTPSETVNEAASEQQEQGTEVQQPVAEPVTTPEVAEEKPESTVEIVIPANVFTPNGDGLNDHFALQVKNVQKFQWIILNASGQVVFRTNDPTARWDGTERNGAAAPAGTYFFVYEAVGEDGTKHSEKSYITLMR